MSRQYFKAPRGGVVIGSAIGKGIGEGVQNYYRAKANALMAGAKQQQMAAQSNFLNSRAEYMRARSGSTPVDLMKVHAAANLALNGQLPDGVSHSVLKGAINNAMDNAQTPEQAKMLMDAAAQGKPVNINQVSTPQPPVQSQAPRAMNLNYGEREMVKGIVNAQSQYNRTELQGQNTLNVEKQRGLDWANRVKNEYEGRLNVVKQQGANSATQQRIRNEGNAVIAQIRGQYGVDVADIRGDASTYAADTRADASGYNADTRAEASKYSADTRAGAVIQSKQIGAEATIKAAQIRAKGAKPGKSPADQAALANLNAINNEIRDTQKKVLTPVTGIDAMTMSPQDKANLKTGHQLVLDGLIKSRDALYQQYPNIAPPGWKPVDLSQPDRTGTPQGGSKASPQGFLPMMRIYHPEEATQAPVGSLLQGRDGNVYKVTKPSVSGKMPSVDSTPVSTAIHPPVQGVPARASQSLPDAQSQAPAPLPPVPAAALPQPGPNDIPGQ